MPNTKNKPTIRFPDEILHHICLFCDRYNIRTKHKKICSIIERIGTTRRIMTKHWQGPFEDEFLIWWDSITIPYKVPTWNTHSYIEPLDLDSCLSLPTKKYIEHQRELQNYGHTETNLWNHTV